MLAYIKSKELTPVPAKSFQWSSSKRSFMTRRTSLQQSSGLKKQEDSIKCAANCRFKAILISSLRIIKLHKEMFPRPPRAAYLSKICKRVQGRSHASRPRRRVRLSTQMINSWLVVARSKTLWRSAEICLATQEAAIQNDPAFEGSAERAIATFLRTMLKRQAAILAISLFAGTRSPSLTKCARSIMLNSSHLIAACNWKPVMTHLTMMETCSIKKEVVLIILTLFLLTTLPRAGPRASQRSRKARVGIAQTLIRAQWAHNWANMWKKKFRVLNRSH